jgi:hypothetical protein
MNVLFVIFLMIFGIILYSTVRQLRASKSNEAVPAGTAGNAEFGADGGDSAADPSPSAPHPCHHHGSGEHASSHDGGVGAGHGFFDGGHGGFDGGGHH